MDQHHYGATFTWCKQISASDLLRDRGFSAVNQHQELAPLENEFVVKTPGRGRIKNRGCSGANSTRRGPIRKGEVVV